MIDPWPLTWLQCTLCLQATLKLLTAMVMQGESAAKTILNQFKLDHSSLKLALNRRDRKVGKKYGNSLNLMPRLQAVVSVLRPCKYKCLESCVATKK